MTSLDRTLSDIASALARLEGRRDAARARALALTGEIELAKGRLALKGEVEAFIEALHGRASRRNLAAFEALLTALVEEVLPGEKPVRLDLSTERGLAALDICLARPDGSLEDVLEDNGGALTNVIGMALRLIAVVKADVGRFLALDEADCWIAPERVPAFYRVLEDGAARLGVQCLAVSHHDLSVFEGAFHIARIVGEPGEGVEVIGPDEHPAWDEAQPGLRFIRLVNVQAYRDATLTLSPGVNALIGPNNRGKSTFIRALRAVFYGEARDSLVRAGEKQALIEIGVAGARILRFTRQPRRTPVNMWSLHEADGSVVEEGGTRHETGGRAVPSWVERLFRITKVEDLDIHVAHQKFPVFLLGETPSRRSAVLSIGQEATYIRDMLTLHKERCNKDMGLVRAGERELIALQDTLDRWQALDGLREDVAEARRAFEALRASEARLDAMTAGAARLASLARALRAARARFEALEDLPAPDAAQALARAVEQAEARAGIARRCLDLSRARGHAAAWRDALAALPETMPPVENAKPLKETAARLAKLRREAEAAALRLVEIEKAQAMVEADLASFLQETNGLCPTCGARADARALLAGHGHARPVAA